jgi:hypothetical protein
LDFVKLWEAGEMGLIEFTQRGNLMSLYWAFALRRFPSSLHIW